MFKERQSSQALSPDFGEWNLMEVGTEEWIGAFKYIHSQYIHADLDLMGWVLVCHLSNAL